MANTKMFVHYSGTVAEFKALSNISDYQNKIVFIKGGADGKGAAIYTHGEYYTSAHDIEALVGSLKAISGVMVNSDASTLKVAQTHDGVLNFCADGETVAVTMDGPGITISVSEAFRNRVSAVETLADNTSEALGTKDDTAKSDGSAFARIANLAALVSELTGGSTDSIESQITSAIGELRTEIVGSLEGSDFKTLEEVKEELGAIDTALDSKADAADVYTKSDVYTKTEVTKAITDEVAKIINDNDDTSINTLEEIAAWIAAHPESVAAINKQISDLSALVGTTSVATQIENKINTLNYADEAATGKYVSEVSEANGIISVKRLDLPTYTLSEGSSNGTVSFNGTDVKVHGLGSAAYTDATAYATAAQGTKADNAVRATTGGGEIVAGNSTRKQFSIENVDGVPTLKIEMPTRGDFLSGKFTDNNGNSPFVGADILWEMFTDIQEQVDALGWVEL